MRMLILTTLLILSACGPSSLQNRAPGAQSGSMTLSRCGCNFEHAPVCGNNGETYTNACMARCRGVTEFNAKACTCDSKSGEVCARSLRRPAQGSGLKAYENECAMVADNAKFKHFGSCLE